MDFSFSIIGNGNIAQWIARTLTNKGYKLLGVWARDTEKAISFAQQFETIIFSSILDIPDKANHICFVAASDSALPEIAQSIHLKHSILIHHAGSIPIDIFAASATNFAVMWPVYSILNFNVESKIAIPLAIEANNTPTLNTLIQLAQKLELAAFSVSHSQRLHLHLAAVLCNNFTNHLVALAHNICAEQQVDYSYLHPIINQTFERLQNNKAYNLQTGPAKRGDTNTINMHLQLIKNEPEAVAVYQSLSASIRKMYRTDEE